MSNTILLVVDVQNLMVKEHPYNEKKVISNIKQLIAAARDNKKEVAYVQHNDGAGGELEYGTGDWQIYDEIAPRDGEKIFHKQFNSAFIKTGLQEYLNSRDIDTIILVGLQTEYCIDATCKSAFEHGFKLIIPEQTNSTFDNEYLPGNKLYEFYNYKIWNKRFGSVVPIEDAVKLLGKAQE